MAQSISQSLLPEFDHEMANTRTMLERVPAERASWSPHPEAMSLGRLAAHLAQMPVWATLGLTRDEFELTSEFANVEMTPQEHLLEVFDHVATEARNHIAAADDARMLQMWTFTRDGHTVMSMPRIVVIRTFAMNHMIHRRGQLSVYLRLNDVPIPALYGPTADEG